MALPRGSARDLRIQLRVDQPTTRKNHAIQSTYCSQNQETGLDKAFAEWRAHEEEDDEARDQDDETREQNDETREPCDAKEDHSLGAQASGVPSPEEGRRSGSRLVR
jgi:hypothetical protein